MCGLGYHLTPLSMIYSFSHLAVWSMTFDHKCFHDREMMFRLRGQDTKPYLALLNGELVP
jgi:hypothetical protein